MKLERKILNALNLWTFIISPSFFVLCYHVIETKFKISIFDLNKLNEISFDLSLGILGTLLTILGVFIALPNNERTDLLKKYNHFNIVLKTILTGAIAAITTILFIISNNFQDKVIYLIITMLVETFIASKRMFQILIYLNKPKEED